MMQSVQILTLVLLALGAWAAQNSMEKAGYCPYFRQVSSDTADCKQMCNDDASCPQNLKCCQRGCSRLCINTTQERDGMCPMATSSSSSSDEQWRNRLCNKTCRTDLDCDGEAKCCASSCGRTCSMPIKAKPGQCPAVAEVCPENRLRIHACRRDAHCNGSKKCCSSGCGQRCMEPFPEEHKAVTRSFRREESTVLAL
ncbi:LOW QUALITY PROTEIN: whey acidic protein-like [Phascolarctos cinereus]|uniref:LOW QUALITY PROTEIN: whey acidic protein-like n=1 Tax=Phascolarctos cinereus TaxID=38626 RepID=A0A6P5J1G6_PHACI|nr:LOW QUALITY PROTEIN: whey acidic protein-like [Phascolarctos cinereus]